MTSSKTEQSREGTKQPAGSICPLHVPGTLGARVGGEGAPVGVAVEGADEGASLGELVGTSVGTAVGTAVGTVVGMVVGAFDGTSVIKDGVGEFVISHRSPNTPAGQMQK